MIICILSHFLISFRNFLNHLGVLGFLCFIWHVDHDVVKSQIPETKGQINCTKEIVFMEYLWCTYVCMLGILIWIRLIWIVLILFVCFLCYLLWTARPWRLAKTQRRFIVEENSLIIHTHRSYNPIHGVYFLTVQLYHYQHFSISIIALILFRRSEVATTWSHPVKEKRREEKARRLKLNP